MAAVLSHPPATKLTAAARNGQESSLSPGAANAFSTDYGNDEAIKAFAAALATTNDSDPYSNTPTHNPAASQSPLPLPLLLGSVVDMTILQLPLYPTGHLSNSAYARLYQV